MTEPEQAFQYLTYWQKQLRLESRDIEMRFAEREEITDGSGAKSRTRMYNGAFILLLPEDELEPHLKRFFRNDLEVRIVHELLHIREHVWRDNPKLSVMDEDEWIRREHEECMDAIAEAMVRARRGMTR